MALLPFRPTSKLTVQYSTPLPRIPSSNSAIVAISRGLALGAVPTPLRTLRLCVRPFPRRLHGKNLTTYDANLLKQTSGQFKNRYTQGPKPDQNPDFWSQKRGFWTGFGPILTLKGTNRTSSAPRKIQYSRRSKTQIHTRIYANSAPKHPPATCHFDPFRAIPSRVRNTSISKSASIKGLERYS